MKTLCGTCAIFRFEQDDTFHYDTISRAYICSGARKRRHGAKVTAAHRMAKR